MISEDKMGKLENVMMNFSAVMMASMMGALGDMMEGFTEAMATAFDTPLEGPDGQPVADVSAHIKEYASEQMLESFAADEAEIDEEMREQVRQKLTDDQVDELFATVEGIDCRLPCFTEKLKPEALLGYAYLAQQEEENFASLFAGVSGWMEANQDVMK